MINAFVSYGRSDRARASVLAAYVNSLGWSVWCDDRLTGGSRYRSVIKSELAKALAVLVIWSPQSVQSHFVEDEAEYARIKGKLIPVKTHDLPVDAIPLGFRSYQTLDFDNKQAIALALLQLFLSVKFGNHAVLTANKQREIAFHAGMQGAAVDLVGTNSEPTPLRHLICGLLKTCIAADVAQVELRCSLAPRHSGLPTLVAALNGGAIEIAEQENIPVDLPEFKMVAVGRE